MKKIKLFLSSSVEGLEKDREELGAFVDDLNNRYKPYGVYFPLIMPDDEAESDFTQEAADSDLFYIIFHGDARKKSIDEFNSAYKSFINGKKPKITTYFKKMENGEHGQSVLDFMERLDKELGHYYNNYAHIDTVKLNFVLQLKSLGLDKVRLEIKDSELCIDAKPIMTLENIPIVFNNKQLAMLKSERSELEKKYWELREKTRQNPDDDEALEELFRVKEQKKRTDEAIHGLQSDIIDMETSFLEKAGSGYISPRQKFARKCMEEGDIEGAKQALAADELKTDAARALEMLNSRKKELQALVGDWIQRAHILHMDRKNPNREAEIDEAYEQAIMLEREGGIARSTLLKYSKYLSLWGQSQKAVGYAEEYLYYLKSNQSMGADYLAVCDHLSRLYRGLNRYDEAEELYKQKLDILKRLAEENPAKYANDLLDDYGSLALFMIFRCQYDKAEELYRQKLDILKRLVENSPEDYESSLAHAYCDLAWHIECVHQYDEAEELYRQSLSIRNRLAEENPAKYASDLARSCIRLANLLVKANRDDEAEELYRQALNIRKRLAKDDPAQYASDLASSCSVLAGILECKNRYDEAEELRRQALDSLKWLAEYDSNPYMCEFKLVSSYNELASLLEKTSRYDEAETLYRQALNIRKGVAEEKSDEYYNESGLADSCYNLANLLKKTSQYDEAEELYRQALNIRKRLLKTNWEDTDLATDFENAMFLADYYTSLAHFMEERSRDEDAEELYRQGLDIQKRLMIYDHTLFLEDYIQARDNLEKLLNKTGRSHLTEMEREAKEQDKSMKEFAQKLLDDSEARKDYDEFLNFKFPLD